MSFKSKIATIVFYLPTLLWLSPVQGLGCDRNNITLCQEECNLLHFGAKDYYRMSTDECEKLVDCSTIQKGQHTYERNAEINKCVSKLDGSVYTILSTGSDSGTGDSEVKPSEVTCGLNAELNSEYGMCYCTKGWFRNGTTGECTESESFYQQDYGALAQNMTVEEQQKALEEMKDRATTRIMVKGSQIIFMAVIVFQILKLFWYEYKLANNPKQEPDWEKEDAKHWLQVNQSRVAKKASQTFIVQDQGGQSFMLQPQTAQTVSKGQSFILTGAVPQSQIKLKSQFNPMTGGVQLFNARRVDDNDTLGAKSAGKLYITRDRPPSSRSISVMNVAPQQQNTHQSVLMPQLQVQYLDQHESIIIPKVKIPHSHRSFIGTTQFQDINDTAMKTPNSYRSAAKKRISITPQNQFSYRSGGFFKKEQ